jgi:hypothetical protein
VTAIPQIQFPFKPKPKTPYVFKSELAIVCEGLADREFFRRLIDVRKLSNFDVPFPHDPNIDQVDKKDQILGGKSRIPHMLRGIKFSESTKAVLLTLDSSDDLSKTFQEACQFIRDAQGYGIPAKPMELASSQNFPSIAITTIPPNEVGALETLCYRALIDGYPHVRACIEELCRCSGVLNWKAEPQGKARLQCGIAVLNQDYPNKSLRWIFERGLQLIPTNNPVFDSIEKLLRDFANLAGVSV